MDTFAPVIAAIDAHDNPGQYATLRAAIVERPTTPRGTMRAWMTAHDGQYVETVQLPDDGRFWIPGARRVDASRASSVSLDESSRDYRGCRVVGASDDALVIVTEFGQPVTILYYVTPAS